MGKDSKDLVSITQLRVVQRFRSAQRWVVVWLRFILIINTTLFLKKPLSKQGLESLLAMSPLPCPFFPE